jgi:hypothetical protein
MKLLGIIIVTFDVTAQLLISFFPPFNRMGEKLGYSESTTPIHRRQESL